MNEEPPLLIPSKEWDFFIKQVMNYYYSRDNDSLSKFIQLFAQRMRKVDHHAIKIQDSNEHRVSTACSSNLVLLTLVDFKSI